MGLAAITSDLCGTLFAITVTGKLFRNCHRRADGTGALLHPGVGELVGDGWAHVQHLAATRVGDRIVLLGVDGAGALHIAQAALPGPHAWDFLPRPIPLADWGTSSQVGPDAASPGPPPPSPSAPSTADAPAPAPTTATPVVQAIFPSLDGTVYMISVAGALVRQRFSLAESSAAEGGTTTPAPATSATPAAAAPPFDPAALRPGPVETLAEAGWGEALASFTCGDGAFFEVTADAVLRVQLTAADAVPAMARWTELARAWSRYSCSFGAGAGRLYAINTEGMLELRSYVRNAEGEVRLLARQASNVVGRGLLTWGGVACEVEGYCWPLSQRPGARVDVHVGVRLSHPPRPMPIDLPDAVTYTVDVVRLHRMAGGVENDMDEVKATPLNGVTFTAPRYALNDDLLTKGAGWQASFSIEIPDLPPDDPGHWRSGAYAARLVDAKGFAFYAPFVVRSGGAHNPFAVLANTNTWNAYNAWGGQGKYTHTHPVPQTLPFQRPHPGLSPVQYAPFLGAMAYSHAVLASSCHLLRAELWILGWLEGLQAHAGPGEDYGYDLYIDQDLHEGIPGLDDGRTPRYQALILNTHPEYWTRQMYDRVKAYVAQGGSIVYLGGNGIYEEVTLSDDGAHMGIFPGLDRTRFPASCSNEQLRLYCLMRSPGVGRPEHALLGVGFQNCEQAQVEGQPYVLAQDPSSPEAHPVLAGVQAKMGDPIGDTSINIASRAGPAATPMHYDANGWEVDQRGAGTPPQAYHPRALLADAQGADDWRGGEMLCFDSDGGGLVFAASSLNFGGSLVADPRLQLIVKNALDLCRSR